MGIPPSFQLAEADVRRLVRLLCEALAPEDGRVSKINRLMKGLSEWVGADGWFWVRSRINPVTKMPENYDFCYGGDLNERHLATWSERSLEVKGRPPENVALHRLMNMGGNHTVTRGQVVPDEVWHLPEHQDYVKRMGHDGVMFSVSQLGENDGVISYVLLLRKIGKPQFAPHEATLVHAVISECGPLHADGLNLTIADDVATLTPRLRTVLAMLIDGHSVKQTAIHLGLSPHTVNSYCKAIYRHFQVESRAELLRRFLHKR